MDGQGHFFWTVQCPGHSFFVQSHRTKKCPAQRKKPNPDPTICDGDFTKIEKLCGRVGGVQTMVIFEDLSMRSIDW